MAPVIMLFTVIGSYSIQNQAFDVYALIGFGIFGYVIKKLGFEPGPLPLAFVLGPMIESSMRQSLLISGGSFSIFIASPISMSLVGIFVVLVIGQAIAAMRSRKANATT
jgi:putative tricarboxylic transport membrane protein